MYSLAFAKPTAGVSFDLLPRRVQIEFNRAFELIIRHPMAPSSDLDIHPLSGYQNAWTLRYIERGGGWRGVYAIDGSEIVFIIFGHRRSVYARLHSLLPPEGRYLTRDSIERRVGV